MKAPASAPLIKFGANARSPDKRENLGQGLRRAFAVPPSGAFSDVLRAIDEAERKVRR